MTAPLPAQLQTVPGPGQPTRRLRRTLARTAGRLQFVRDPMRLALFVTTVLTVSRVHQHYGFLAKFRPVLLLVIAAAGYAYLNPKYLTRANVLTLWPMRMVALLGVLACGSAVFGISLGATANFILDSYSKTLIYAFLLVVSIRHVDDLFTYIWAYVISCGILVFFSLFVFGITKASNSLVTRLDHLYTYDSNDLGVVLLIGLALTLLLLQVSRGPQRLFLFLNLAGIAAAIARSGSRGGFIGIVVVGLAALFLVNSVSVGRRVGILAVLTLALVLGAPPGYWEQMNTLLSPKEDYNFSSRDGRKALLKRGLGYANQYPIFGLGINNFSRAECTISPKIERPGRPGPLRCTAPHNSFMQAGSELGYPGFIAWITIVIGGIVAPLRIRKRLPRSWRRGSEVERFMYEATTYLPLAMIAFASTAFFVSFAWMDPIYILAAFISGWYIVARGRVPHLRGQEARVLATALGLIRDSSSGWRVRRSARWFRMPLTAPSPK
jgi:hypothetical protein